MKGIYFERLVEIAAPFELANKYNEQGADELVFLDITATNEGRGIMRDVVERNAKEIIMERL